MSLRSSVPGIMALVCIVVSGVSCKDATVDIRFIPEDKAIYELSYEVAASGQLNGKEQTHDILNVWELQISKDTIASDINATYKRFKAFMRSPEDSFQVDSDHPVPDSIGRNDAGMLAPWVWQAVKGLGFTYRMNNLGRTESIGSFTPLLTSLSKKLMQDSALAKTERFSAIWDIAASQFNADLIRDVLQQVFPEFPGKALRAGDTLNRTFKYNAGLPLMVVQFLKVSEITDSHVSFLMGGSGFTENNQAYTLKAEQQGKFVVNRQTGVMESAYIEEMITGTADNQPFQQSRTIKASCRRIN